MMKLITRFLTAFLIIGTLFTAGCALRLTDEEEELPPAEPVPVNLPSEGAPDDAPSAGTNVSSEAYYESTANERRQMMDGTNERPDLDNQTQSQTTSTSTSTSSSGTGSTSGSQSDSGGGTSGTTADTGGQEVDTTPAPAPKVGTPVEGRDGYITSPNSDDPDAIIDVRGLPPGTEIKDPHSPGNTILVP